MTATLNLNPILTPPRRHPGLASPIPSYASFLACAEWLQRLHIRINATIIVKYFFQQKTTVNKTNQTHGVEHNDFDPENDDWL